MSSRQCIVPSNWNYNNNMATRHQIRQEQVEAGVVSSSTTAAAVNRSSSHHHHRNHVLHSNQQQLLLQIPSSGSLSSTATATATATTTTTTTPHLVVPMSDREVGELTWENGQLALHCLSGLIHSGPTKPTWGRASETLESIVRHPAASHKPNPNWHHDEPHHPPASLSFSRGGNWTDISSGDAGKPAPSFTNEPCQSEQNQCARNFSGNSSSFTTHQDGQKHYVDGSACASASATHCRENDTTTITRASFESPGNFKTKTTEEVSACIGGGSENQDEDRETKAETVKSHTSRRSRVAAVHNQSERRRRHRINQKLKTLQKLVPNASKTDKASILDEVIDYLKQLQLQVQFMSMRNMPGMMMTLGMQQQLQMSLLARMGMGMMNTSNLAVRGGAPECLPQLLHPTSPAGAATFVPPPFTVPSHMIPTQSVIQAGPEPSGTESASAALPDPFCTYLAQSMSMDFYNKMAALYQQQVNQTIQAKSSSPSQSDHHVLQRD